MTGVKGAKAAITATAAQLWPYKFVTSLLARLIQQTSINVQTHTCVTSITESPDGASIVTTPRGVILAKKVVIATNGYTSGIVPEYAHKIVPIKITCSHIKPPHDTEHPPPHLTQTYGLSYGHGHRDYLNPRPDGGVICGGATQVHVGNKNNTHNNFDDSSLIESARAHFDTVMQDNFRGWEKSGAAVDYLWTGSKSQPSP